MEERIPEHDPDEHEIPIGGFVFTIYWQQGEMVRDRWVRSVDHLGSTCLLVCECGQGLFDTNPLTGVPKLKDTYQLSSDGRHTHRTGSTIPCDIVKFTQSGETGFVVKSK